MRDGTDTVIAVMAGLVPAIHALRRRCANLPAFRLRPDVDGRAKPGHDAEVDVWVKLESRGIARALNLAEAYFPVMAGLVPAIHVPRLRRANRPAFRRPPDVDGRAKPGHDGGSAWKVRLILAMNPDWTDFYETLNR